MSVNRRRVFAGVALWAAVLLAAVCAEAGVTYDAGTGFVLGPAPQSPTSLWQYFGSDRGPSVSSGATYTPLPNFDPTWNSKTDLQGWDNNTYPVVAKNTGAAGIQVFASMNDPVPPGGILLHPFDERTSTGAVAVGWLSPLTGLVSIALTVTDADSATNNPNSDGVSWFLDCKGGSTFVPLLSGVVDADVAPYDPSGEDKTDSASLANVPVTAGDFIYLTINPVGTGGTSPGSAYYYDATLLSLTITEQDPSSLIPEPAALGVLGLSVAGWAAARRRRRE